MIIQVQLWNPEHSNGVSHHCGAWNWCSLVRFCFAYTSGKVISVYSQFAVHCRNPCYSMSQDHSICYISHPDSWKKLILCFTGKGVQSLKLCPLIHIQEVATFLAPAPTFLRNVVLHKLFNPVHAELSVIVVVAFESLLVIWVGQTWIKPLFDPRGKAQNCVALNVATKQTFFFTTMLLSISTWSFWGPIETLRFNASVLHRIYGGPPLPQTWHPERRCWVQRHRDHVRTYMTFNKL